MKRSEAKPRRWFCLLWFCGKKGGRTQNHNKAGLSCCLSQPATKPQHTGPSREACPAAHRTFPALSRPPIQYCKSTNCRSRCVTHLHPPIKSCGELKQAVARIFGQTVGTQCMPRGEICESYSARSKMGRQMSNLTLFVHII